MSGWKMALFALSILVSATGSAQEELTDKENAFREELLMLPPPPEYTEVPTEGECRFGDYACEHHLLHEPLTDMFGLGIEIPSVIEQLRSKQARRSCCDDVGECRPTSIEIHKGRTIAWLDGRWCPIVEGMIDFDITLPPKISATVCAKKGSPTTCAIVFCAATTISG